MKIEEDAVNALRPGIVAKATAVHTARSLTHVVRSGAVNNTGPLDSLGKKGLRRMMGGGSNCHMM